MFEGLLWMGGETQSLGLCGAELERQKNRFYLNRREISLSVELIASGGGDLPVTGGVQAETQDVHREISTQARRLL